MSLEQENSSHDILKEELAKAQRLGESITGSLKGKLIRWAIRWTIGFSLIAVLVHFKPGWQWVWYAGAGTAAFSLTMMLLLRQVVQRRLNRLHAGIKEEESLQPDNQEQDFTP